jgi:hypothetical protein
MSTRTDSLQRGKLIPDWSLTDSSGASHKVWDFRQKSHLVLIYEPTATMETQAHWNAAVKADWKQWDWLNVAVVIVAKAPKELMPGAYAVDRYGILIGDYPAGQWTFDQIEREFLNYEAKHC